MANMGVWDSMKDWASKKMASSEFVTYVEQATNETLLAPNYDMFMVLVDAANDPKGEWVSDVVRSVRIRLDSSNPKVKLFTLELISVLVQNCGLKFHHEMAENKGLLNAIVETACLRQDLVRGPLAEARKSAIQLIVNLDVWFKHHPAREKVESLAKLIDDAKSRNAVFENVIPDTTTRIITDKYARRSTATETQRSGHEIMTNGSFPNFRAAEGGADAAAAAGGAAYSVDRASGAAAQQPSLVQQRAAYMRGTQQQRAPVRDEVIIVEAIPCEEPSEERRAGMFEAVMLLGECFHAAKASGERLDNNEMITGVAQQVREDFMFISTLVNSGAVLEQADTLGSLYESQRTVLRELRDAIEGSSRHAVPSAPPGPRPAPATSASASASVSSSSIVTGGVATGAAQNRPGPAAGGGAKSAAPTLDELFAQSAPKPATSSFSTAAAAPSSLDALFSLVAGGSAATGSAAPTATLPAGVAMSVVGGSSGGDGSLTARRQALTDPVPRQNMNHHQNPYGSGKAGEIVDVELHSPKEGPEPAPAARGAAAPPRVAADTEGDFDAFLNARLAGSVQNNN